MNGDHVLEEIYLEMTRTFCYDYIISPVPVTLLAEKSKDMHRARAQGP